MRCPDCNKFVSFDEEGMEPEAEDGEIEVDGESVIYQAEVRRVLCCAECGTELKEFNFTWSQTLTAEDMSGKDGSSSFNSDCEGDEAEDSKHTWSVSSVEATSTSKDVPRVGKTGKPLKGSTTLLGVDVEVTCACDHCDATFSFTASHEGEESSAFDDAC